MKRPSCSWMVPAIAIAVVMVAVLPGCKDLGSEPDPPASTGPVTPQAPVALTATGITATGFTATWQASTGATEYRLDVGRDSLYVSFVTGLQDKNVGVVTSFGVTGLTTGSRYFYRVRAVGSGGTSASSNTIGVTVIATASISFQARVLPILTNYGCTGCHGGSGGLFVGTVAQLLTGGNHGPAVVAGDGANSNLIKKLGTPPPFGSRMPLGGSALPADTIAVLRTWIDQGALNN
jgi:hypothetical protein